MACPITSCLGELLINKTTTQILTSMEVKVLMDQRSFSYFGVKNSPHRNNTAVWKSFQKSWPSLEVMNCSSLLNAKSLKVLFHTGIQNFRKLLHLFFTFHIHNIIFTFCFTWMYVIQTDTKTIFLFFLFQLYE